MRRALYCSPAAIIAGFLLLAITPTQIRAASPDNHPGTLTGIVVNAKGAPVAGAQVPGSRAVTAKRKMRRKKR